MGDIFIFVTIINEACVMYTCLNGKKKEVKMMTKKIPLCKVLIGVFIFLSAILATGCYEGFVAGPEGLILQDYLNPADLLYLTENPEPDIFIIDVRPEAAYNSGHIPTALSFSSGTIMSRLEEPPLDDLDNYLILY